MFKKISIYFIVFTILILPIFSHAQGQGQQTSPAPSTGITIPNPTTAGSDLMSVLLTLLRNVVMPIAAVAVVMWIIWAGFNYVLAQGNPAKVAQAHQRLLWSLIGAGILLGAVAISEVVKSTITALLK